MREIKFRAWDRVNNKMVGHRYLEHYNPGLRVFASEEFEVMQFCGLKDKNSAEIYEGDIFSDQFGYARVVRFDFGAFYAYHDKEQTMVLASQVVTGEVIGNIYENPELLSKAA